MEASEAWEQYRDQSREAIVCNEEGLRRGCELPSLPEHSSLTTDSCEDQDLETK